jgi:hypothetical protein
MKNETKTAVKTETPASMFNRTIGNTTYVVSVAFSEKARESLQDKIIRLITNDNQQEVRQCN